MQLRHEAQFDSRCGWSQQIFAAEGVVMKKIVLGLVACFLLAFLASAASALCTGSLSFAPGSSDDTESANCFASFPPIRCYPPEVSAPLVTFAPGCDPLFGGCGATIQVPVRFPGSHFNDPSVVGFGYSYATVRVSETGVGTIGSCGVPGAPILTDDGVASWGAMLSCLGTNPSFTITATSCPCFGGPICGPFCPQTTSIPVDLSAQLAAICGFLPPPPSGCGGDDECRNCGGIGGGSAGPGVGGGPGASPGSPAAPGKPGGNASGVGAGVGGDGIAASPGGSGPGALLRYRARGAGHPGHPGSTAWNVALGRYWSHDAAERIVRDPDDSHVWLITRYATFREFTDTDADGVYDVVSPSDEYRTLTKTATGWELRFHEGTIQRHDDTGLWTETEDPNGNKTVAFYTAGVLTTVTFPDGRSETFEYDGTGKLFKVKEVGIDGTTEREWVYTWTGDDLERIDRPDGTAWSFRYDDTNRPGYMTRMTLVGTDSSERIDRAWSYDSLGNVEASWRGAATVDDAAAVEVWRFGYDNPATPSVTTITDPLGNDSVYTFDRDPRSLKVRVMRIEGDCPSCGTGPNSQLVYGDADHPLLATEIIDGRGTRTLFAYDANGQLVSRIEAFMDSLERETTWDYDPNFPSLATEMTQPSTTGNINDFRIATTMYTPSGDAETRTISGIEDGAPFSLVTTTAYTVEGLIDTINPPGFGTTDVIDLDYDDATRGNVILTSRTDPLVGTTSFGYDAFNRRASVTDPNGVVVDTEYDALNRTTRRIHRGPDDMTEADDLVTEHRYTVFGDLFQIVLPEGNVIEYGYDHVGRLESIERKIDDQPTSHGERTLFTLNSFGHRTREDLERWDDSAGAWVTLSSTAKEYATRCFLDKTIEGAGSANESVTEYAYDCEGNIERIWDANHPSAWQTNPASTEYVYDVLNRLTRIERPFGSTGADAVTIYTYDEQDHLSSATDAEGTVTTHEYSDRDLLTKEISEVSGTSMFVYNDHGVLTHGTDARMITVTRTIDELDRVTFVDYPDDTLDITYTYDDPMVPFSAGRVTAITRDGASIDYGYDRFGRMTKDGALTFDYDKNGNRSTIDYPSGVSTTTSYDFADRPEILDATLPGLGTTAIISATSYLPFGPVDELTLGNGIVETRAHDARYHPDRITAGPSGGGALLDWDYTTDDVSNITSIADILAPGQSRTYDYLDHQYFLTQGDGPWGDHAWTYDQIGNRETETRGTDIDVYTYEPNVAGGNSPTLASVVLASGGTTVFQYDDAGNQTQSAGARTLDYSFDDASRLTTLSDGVFEVANTYDGRGFLRRSERTNPGAVFADGFEGDTLACWSEIIGGSGGGTCPVAPISVNPTYSSDGLLYHVVRGFGDHDRWVLYHAGRPVAIVEQLGASSAEVIYLTTDHLGTPALASDWAGGATWDGGFEPFGADYADASGDGIFLRFPGQWDDGVWSDGGQSYNVHRWYSEEAGRYNRTDPATRMQLLSIVSSHEQSLVANGGGAHPFAYVLSSPLVYTDSLGLAHCTYRIRTQKLKCRFKGGDVQMVGPDGVFSGQAGTCMNNPRCQGVRFVGPIPAGIYQINEDGRPNHETWLRLEPVPRVAGWKVWTGLRRGGFAMHVGGNSAGCITVDRDNQEAVEDYLDLRTALLNEMPNNTLHVLP